MTEPDLNRRARRQLVRAAKRKNPNAGRNDRLDVLISLDQKNGSDLSGREIENVRDVNPFNHGKFA